MDLINPQEDDDEDDNATILYDPSSEVAVGEADWTYMSWTEKVMSSSVSFALVKGEEPHSYGCFQTSMSLAATGPAKRKKARAEATKTDIRQFSKQFHQAKLDEMKSWKDNEVYELVDTRKFQPKNYVTGRWVLTVTRNADGSFQKCKARWVLRGFQDKQKWDQQTDGQPDSYAAGVSYVVPARSQYGLGFCSC